jgi:hypothetical protein
MKSIAILACTVCLVALTPRLHGQRFATLYNTPGDPQSG